MERGRRASYQKHSILCWDYMPRSGFLPHYQEQPVSRLVGTIANGGRISHYRGRSICMVQQNSTVQSNIRLVRTYQLPIVSLALASTTIRSYPGRDHSLTNNIEP